GGRAAGCVNGALDCGAEDRERVAAEPAVEGEAAGGQRVAAAVVHGHLVVAAQAVDREVRRSVIRNRRATVNDQRKVGAVSGEHKGIVAGGAVDDRLAVQNDVVAVAALIGDVERAAAGTGNGRAFGQAIEDATDRLRTVIV